MSKSPAKFKAAAEAMGVRVGKVWADDVEEMYIDNRDCTMAQGRKLAKLAAECGLEVLVCDKGAAFR